MVGLSGSTLLGKLKTINMKLLITVEHLSGMTNPQITIGLYNQNDPIAVEIVKLMDLTMINSLVQSNRIQQTKNSTTNKKIYEYHFD